MSIPIFSLALYNILSVIIFWITGKFILAIGGACITSRYKKNFLELLTGAITISFGTALFYTRGYTIMMLLLLPVGFILYHTWKGKSISYKSSFLKTDYIPLIQTIVVSILIFLLFFVLLQNSGLNINLPHYDYIFYSKGSFHIIKHGYENINLEYLYEPNMGNTPYHYFELWLNGFTFKIFNIPSLLSLIFIIYPIGIAFMWLGFLSLSEHFNLLNYKIKIFALLFLFFTGAYIPLYKPIFLYNAFINFTPNVFSYSKLFSIYLLIQAFFLVSYSNNKERVLISYAILLIIPIIFISTIIGILMGVGTYFIVNYLVDKKNKQLYLKLFSLYFILGISILLFYYLLYQKNTVTLSKMTFEIDANFFIRAIKIILGSTIQIIVLYIPLIFILIYIKYTCKFDKHFIVNNKHIVLFMVLYVFSILAWVFLPNFPDSVQLFNNIIFPFMHISIFIFLIKIYNKKYIAIFLYPFIGCMIIINILFTINEVRRSDITVYSEAYLKEISIHIKNKNPVGSFLLDKSEYSYMFVKNSDLFCLGQYLNLLGSEYHTISLSVFDIPITSPFEEFSVKSTNFYKFVESQKKANNFVSIAQSQIDFVKKYKIDYLIISPKVTLAEHWKPLIDKELIDEKSKEHFIILKR
jgi:hypothetical protein